MRNKNKRFNLWITRVEKIIFKKLNLYLLDLPDECYYDNFSNGITPSKMAKIIIDNNLIF